MSRYYAFTCIPFTKTRIIIAYSTLNKRRLQRHLIQCWKLEVQKWKAVLCMKFKFLLKIKQVALTTYQNIRNYSESRG
jgi:hypothetical protein